MASSLPGLIQPLRVLSASFTSSLSSLSTRESYFRNSFIWAPKLSWMVSFVLMDKHIPDSTAKFQTYIYSDLMYLCMSSFPKPKHSKWNSSSFDSFILKFASSCLPFSLQQTSQTRNGGVTLDNISYTLTANHYWTLLLQPQKHLSAATSPLFERSSLAKSLLTSLLVLTTFHLTIGS